GLSISVLKAERLGATSWPKAHPSRWPRSNAAIQATCLFRFYISRFPSFESRDGLHHHRDFVGKLLRALEDKMQAHVAALDTGRGGQNAVGRHELFLLGLCAGLG